MVVWYGEKDTEVSRSVGRINSQTASRFREDTQNREAGGDALRQPKLKLSNRSAACQCCWWCGMAKEILKSLGLKGGKAHKRHQLEKTHRTWRQGSTL